MRTNIDLDDKLLSEAMKTSKSPTKKDLMNKLLQDYVKYQRRLKLLDLQGKVEWIGNLDKMRTYDKWENR